MFRFTHRSSLSTRLSLAARMQISENKATAANMTGRSIYVRRIIQHRIGQNEANCQVAQAMQHHGAECGTHAPPLVPVSLSRKHARPRHKNHRTAETKEPDN